MKLIYLCLLFFTTPVLAQLKADFSVSSTQGCMPLSVNFQDNSLGSPTSWFWDFGNGITSSNRNPSVTYAQSGSYSVRLIVRNAGQQDFKEIDNYITVYQTPVAKFDITSGDSGCVNLKSDFSDSSDFAGATAKSWLWDFGDGSTSSQQNPTHTYTAEGRYSVSLTVQTIQGCSSTVTRSSAVSAGNKPVAAFSALPLSGCASVLRQFKNKSTGKLTASEWDFGDGGISYDRSPDYHYQDTGTFTVKLKVSEYGCMDSIEIPNYIHVDGPVAKFFTHVNCSDRFTVTYDDKSIGETSQLWDLGDGSTSTGIHVVHVYSNPGIYVVKLMITGTACNDTATDTVHIKVTTPSIAITPDKNSYCKFDTLNFSIINYDVPFSKNFSWDFGDGITTLQRNTNNNIVHVYDSAGKFNPIAYIRDYASCTDTVSFNGLVTINGPTADFGAASGCTNTAIDFKERSAAFGSPIKQWLWSFGDGIITTSLTGSTNYIYAFPGDYIVNLTVTDTNGCTDSVTHTINVFQTPTVDAGIDTFTCSGSGVTLNPSGGSSYIWQNNPDLSCTNCANPVAKPQQSATYFVTGTSNGCSASDSVNVAVQTKELITAQPDSYSICNGDSVTLNISGADNYNWLPATTLSNTTIQNPVAFPTTNTIYTVTGKDSNNCFSDVAMISVTVNPSPTVNITDSIVQILTGSTYTILASASNDAQSFEWLPPTNLSCNSCLQPVATVEQTTTYNLKATNQFGCSDSDKITIISVCTGESIFLPNTFSPNNDGMNDYFYPRSNADITIKSLTIFNRWGQLIFQKRNFSSNNATYGWDGRYKNVLQKPDVYIYVMELQCSGSKTVIKKGDISLLR